MDLTIFNNLTQGMLLMFSLGILCLLIFAWTKIDQTVQHGEHTHKKYLKLTLPNILFHIIASFAVLLLLHELSNVLISNFMPALKGSGTYNNTLSFLVGLFGSVIVAWVIEKGKKKFSTKAKS